MSHATLPRFSGYDDSEWVGRELRNGRHRDMIGGLWEELGALQLAFLIERGLQPQHTLIDIGAGPFRAGVKLVPYLDPGNYYAIDTQLSLLAAGYSREIEPKRLSMRFPRCNFAQSADFELASFERFFDFGIAQSVFTHMPLQRMRDCLAAIAPYFRSGAKFFATVFLAGEREAVGPVNQFPGIKTHPDRDPFHTSLSALSLLGGEEAQWEMEVIGNWGHPRNQKMISFSRL